MALRTLEEKMRVQEQLLESDLAFKDEKLLKISKIGIFLGSTICGLLGYYLLYRRPEYDTEAREPFDESQS